MSEIKTLTVNGKTYTVADPDAAHIDDSAVGANAWSSGKITQTVANALKGSASGNYVRIDDVSPLEHEISVKVDVPNAKVTKYGKNLFDASKLLAASNWTVDENGVYSGRSFDLMKAYAQANPFMTFEGIDQFTFSFYGRYLEGGTGAGIYVQVNYDDGTNQALLSVRSSADTFYTATTKAGKKPVSLYFSYGATAGTHWLHDIQLEIGTTATPYEPYVEPITYTADENGDVKGVMSVCPSTTLIAEDGATITTQYNKDTNKVVESLTQAIISLGGNV